jgi:plasmid stabilization system protein ParE
LDYRLTEAAEADITDILRETTRRFGRSQRGRYAGYLQRAIELIGANPDLAGSRHRSELGVREFAHFTSSWPRGVSAPRRTFFTISVLFSMTIRRELSSFASFTRRWTRNDTCPASGRNRHRVEPIAGAAVAG